MRPNDWLTRLQYLAARFQHYGIAGDLAGLALVDAWGLYLYLQRLAER
jgi:hypothetical protein